MADLSDLVTEQPAAPTEPPPAEPSRRTLPVPWPTLALLAVLAVFAVALWDNGQLGNFVSWRHFRDLLRHNAVTLVVALGMLLVIISGGIDLSVGSVAALVTVVTVLAYNAVLERTGSEAVASAAAVAAGVGVGGLCGLVNGLSVTLLRVTPFVATLGMYGMARGAGVWLADRKTVPMHGEQPEWLSALARAEWGRSLPGVGVWSALLLCVVIAVLLRRTVFGRHVYAIGSNEATARLCGVAVERTKLCVYVLAGLLTGWAGVLLLARLNSGNGDVAVGLELDVIAAVVVGGASLAGGRGGVAGTLFGVLALAALERAVSFLELIVEVKLILIGAIVVLSTALGQWQRRRGG